ncbi:MAG: glycosyltransferase family 2 protein [Lishizhenia sp.]
MKEKSVAVVILNYNGKSFLEKFLGGVLKYSGQHKVVLADNQSTDESLSYVRNNFPSVEIIVNTENGGFAKGYNDALKQVDADYYILLNSDIEVTPNWIEPLLETALRTEAVGVQPKVRSQIHPSKFEHAGAAGGYLDVNFYPFCRGRIFEAVEDDQSQYNSEQEIFWATGACLLIDAKVYHEVGGLDEDFFAHMEEIDLCWRLKKLGHKFMVQPNSVVYHVGGGTLNYDNPRKTYLNFRNSLFMIHKNYAGFLPGMIFKRLLIDGLAGAKFLVGFQLKHFMALFKAHIHYYKNLKSLRAKRKAIKRLTANTKSNDIGYYTGNIIFARYFKGVKKFSELNQRLFK